MRIVAKHLTGAYQGEIQLLNLASLSIGRAPTSDLRLGINDTRASGRHALIEIESGQAVLRDSGSTNGTFVNGQRTQQTVLKNGDIVEFGTGGPKVQFQFEPDSAPTTSDKRTEAIPPAPTTPRQAKPLPPRLQETEEEISTTLPPLPHFAAAERLPGDREFIIKSKWKYALALPGLLGFIGGMCLFIFSSPLFAAPLVLLSLLALFIGLAIGRKNITVTKDGVRYEGFWKTQTINWDDVEDLRAQRSRTQLLTHQVYTIKGRRGQITFTTTGYLQGLELAQLVSNQAGKKWH